MYILYIIVLKIKLITNLHELSVAVHVLSNSRRRRRRYLRHHHYPQAALCARGYTCCEGALWRE